MCSKDSWSDNSESKALFDTVKEKLIKMCSDNEDSIEYRNFKKVMEDVSSFDELISKLRKL